METSASPSAPPAWRPISATDRRVLGVLAEKAKTTPDVYPMTINAIVTGSNQKNNRAPVTRLEEADVSDALDRLRQLGAVKLVMGSGRAEKFRHALYEWLGVDKFELAVMTELLLRGPQTEGELRGRAARMEPIADLAALRPILTSLKTKGLVIPLSSEGRGHVVSHALFEPREMDRVRRDHAAMLAGVEEAADHREGAAITSAAHASAAAPPSTTAAVAAAHGSAPPAPRQDELGALRREIDSLRGELRTLRDEFERLDDNFELSRKELDRLRQALGG